MYQIEVRELKENKLECLVNNYDWSKMLTDKQGRRFKERIAQSVWENAIANNQSIKVYLNHQDYIEIGSNITISTTNDGVLLTLELSNKEIGLYKAAQEQRLTGCSFGFKCLNEKITDREDYYEREILDFELYEISILDKTPAYNNTAIEARELKPYTTKLLLKELELLKLA